MHTLQNVFAYTIFWQISPKIVGLLVDVTCQIPRIPHANGWKTPKTKNDKRLKWKEKHQEMVLKNGKIHRYRYRHRHRYHNDNKRTTESNERTNIRTNEGNEQCERFMPNSINNHKMQFSKICLSKSFENWDYLTACEGLRESK